MPISISPQLVTPGTEADVVPAKTYAEPDEIP